MKAEKRGGGLKALLKMETPKTGESREEKRERERARQREREMDREEKEGELEE